MSRKEGYVAKYLRKRASHKKFVYKSQLHLQCRGLSQFLKHEVSRKDEMQNMWEGRKDEMQNMWEGRKNMWDRRKYMIQNMREKVFFPLTSDGYLCTALKENCLHKSALEPCGPTMPKYNPVYTHLHSWVESGIVKGKCLAQEYITMTHTDLKPCHLDLQSCMLTVYTFHLPNLLAIFKM